jgi:[glutamine synthetase] adenylyltransferase / [glutamine synthetase]-adenylyl-L-tyrosine phosphorylase
VKVGAAAGKGEGRPPHRAGRSRRRLGLATRSRGPHPLRRHEHCRGRRLALRDAERAGRLRDLDLQQPGRGSGYVVLALGKHGAFELNYSSDVDLIILYDPDSAPLAEGLEPARFFVRLSKRLVGLLQDVTEDGFAFRVDLRLRPDPRATQIAIAIEAAANHYEYMGQNWERAAMIKARPVAGDLALGQEFLSRLTPYVWRKYLDFAAIADIQSLKRQIHQVKGHGKIAVHGHNIKLGAAAFARSSSSSRPSS